ncbi:hypothetical protein A9995_00765 [Erythrobacter sp. QSSC1-22B]|uniref:DUF1178 family protein n=1 Tax=Erythrobacter sp. QSSC1-22B TaxID=1860125 RepID=UPI000805D1A5|nr:DUF1178 family protein [Erythrobacter sp. QSSC1-22B]OBX20296.1 hypothetical protein A9995_00765 [Erythrobacter sp. QSSC1-22B]
MIVYDLHCAQGHRFEGWFGSSDDFADQQNRNLVECPECGSQDVGKAPMAPAVPLKGNQRTSAVIPKDGKPVTNREIPPEVQQAMRALAEAQVKALRKSTYVGDGFAEESRAMHYGEKDVEAIHGKATVREAKELIEEGIAVAPLPFPIAEPDKLN